MHIEGEKDVLAEAVQAALRVISTRAALPVLGGIRITAAREGVEFAATDLEMFIAIEADFGVRQEGVVVLPGKLLGEVVRSLPAGRVRIRGGESEVTIESGKVEFALSGLRVEDFPEFAAREEGMSSSVAGGELAGALRQVVRAASTDEARPVLTGVLWALEGEVLRLAATDSYRLGVREVAVKEGAGEGRAIIPGRALGEFGRHLSGEAVAEVRLGPTQATCVAGRVRLVTRLIEGEFPNYRRLIPEGYVNRMVVGREALGEAIRRVGVVAQVNTPIKLHVGEEVRLTAAETGVGEAAEVIDDALYTGEPMVVAFNPRFLGEGVESVEGDKALVEFGDPAKPVLVKGEDRPEFVYLVMPVRLTR